MRPLSHESFVDIYNKNDKVFNWLFNESTNTLSKLMSKIEKISEKNIELSYDSKDKLKGDLFEIFAECFFIILSADNRVGVYEYKTVNSIDDYGVDGYGVGMDGLPLTVQVKYRSNVDLELMESDIKQFAFQSIVNYSVDKDTKNNMIVFTNASGLHWLTESKVFNHRIRSIDFKFISKLINNNSVFWKNVNDIIKITIDSRYETST